MYDFELLVKPDEFKQNKKRHRNNIRKRKIKKIVSYIVATIFILAVIFIPAIIENLL